MPKFLRIGVHQSNVSGYTSKAWCIRRVGSTVFLKWGAVEVHGIGDVRKVYWTLPPRDKTIRCGTVQRAKDYAKAAIARRRSHRYEPLTGNIASRRRTADRGAELEQALATILFVDIVRSTEKAAKLGDARWTQGMDCWRRSPCPLPGSVARPRSARPCARSGWRSGWGCTRANTK